MMCVEIVIFYEWNLVGESVIPKGELLKKAERKLPGPETPSSPYNPQHRGYQSNHF